MHTSHYCNYNFTQLIWLKAIVLSVLIVSSSAVRLSTGCTNPPSNGLGSGLEPGGHKTFKRKIPGTQQRTHRVNLPSNYGSEGVASPLILYFHGWGGDYQSCGDRCESDAVGKGFVTVTMTGYGPSGWNSWKHAGSSDSSAENPSCAPETSGFCGQYSNSGCDCSQADNCWWTTCHDSVEQALAILDEVEEDLCVDLDQIWAVGCSNGGMFTFELAADSRSASRLKGIVPIVGLPHYGYSRGPLIEGIRMMGMWGRDDGVVPPISNTDNPDKTSDPDGWHYAASDKVMKDWTSEKGCSGSGQDQLGEEDWGIGKFGDKLSCTQGCGEKQNGDRVVGCVFEGGHECSWNFIWDPILEFMLDQPDQPSSCTENDDDQFLLKQTKNGPVVEDCLWLQAQGNKEKNKICKKNTAHDDDFDPAQDVCKSTCNSCGCYENPKTRFLLRVKNGKAKTKSCRWLGEKKNADEICKKKTKSFGGYRPPAEACRITCGTDPC